MESDSKSIFKLPLFIYLSIFEKIKILFNMEKIIHKRARAPLDDATYVAKTQLKPSKHGYGSSAVGTASGYCSLILGALHVFVFDTSYTIG